jgi:hypothetical protein
MTGKAIIKLDDAYPKANIQWLRVQQTSEIAIEGQEMKGTFLCFGLTRRPG